MSVLPVVLAVVLLAIAAFSAVVGVAGLVGRLPRNRWVGVRTDETMRSETAFTVANRVAAPGLLAGAAILVLAAVVAIGVGGYWSIVVTVVGLLAAGFLLGLVSAYGVRAAAAVPAESGGCGCCSGEGHADKAHGEDAAGTGAATADEAAAAADCGASSCGACSLRGACTNESATH